MKIFRKTMLFIAAAGLLFSLALFVFIKIFLPQEKIKQYIVSYAKENFNREVSFDTVSFNIIGINLNNFALSERTDFTKGTFIKAKNLTVKISLKPLLHKKIEVQTLSIDGMNIQMHKDKNGRFNFNDISTKKEQSAENVENKVKTVKNDIPFKIDNFQIKDSTVSFKDDILNLDTKISDFNMHMTDFSFTELFPCEISFTFKYKQSNIDALLPVRLKTQLNLNNLDFDKLFVDVISFETTYKDSTFSATGKFENINMPKIDLKITCKNIRETTLKDFYISKTKFNIQAIDCIAKTIINLENKTADIEQLEILLPQSTCNISGTVNWRDKDLKYNLKTNIDILLDKLSEFVPKYALNGRIKSKLEISNSVFNGNIEGTNISFKSEQPSVDLKNTNFKVIIHSKNNIILNNSSGIFNTGNFTFSGSYSGNDIDLKLKMDKLLIKESSSTATTKKEQTNEQTKDENKSDYNINLNTDVSIDNLDVPYLTGRNAYFKTSLKSITPDMKIVNGSCTAGVENGKITNVEKLAENKFAKIFLMIFNVLNNNIKHSQKIDDTHKKGINYDSLIFDVAFTNGKLTTKKIKFKMPVTAITTTGFVDFKADSISLNVNTGLYAKMKVTGTVENPKTSFDVIGTVGEILKNTSKRKNSNLGKLDRALKNLFGR
ncbi:MAG: AsmA family protein [Endomicrobiaceae bacterium]|jgi:AsmA protein|nr:AsmA family protein [Endomicrobiaceae bacterium]MDD3729683.1 AsmA family protein [Endomicrobiaceae bacterium]MDD4165795.1 AsmA family protein [Endomicrobiaceae bacterium]